MDWVTASAVRVARVVSICENSFLPNALLTILLTGLVTKAGSPRREFRMM